MANSPYLLHHLLEHSAAVGPEREALVDKERREDYAAFLDGARMCAATLRAAGIDRRDRVAIYLTKSLEEAHSIFGVSLAGGVFVPINALLRPSQVKHIVDDCGVRFLITGAERYGQLREELAESPSLERILLIDAAPEDADLRVLGSAFEGPDAAATGPEPLGEDLAAILYTSGSTGKPKGVMLSHRNLVAGSRMVSRYVEINESDRILSVLPFSFDYGLNQLITAAEQGATTVLLNFRFGDEIVRALAKERITGLAGVPTIWAVLTRAAPTLYKTELPQLRYLTNSGGAVPTETVARVRETLPHVSFFLMYGLTEAFRSTYLPPEEIDRRPTSMGKAIPETEVFVVSAEGKLCGPGEEGILVHRGPTVSLGYWGRPGDTARVLRPNPLVAPNEGGDIVCYSGDLVRMDEEGFLYFVGRGDAMIKCSGYRVSPTEVEEVLMLSGRLAQAAVIGLPDPVMGNRIHAVVIAAEGHDSDPVPLLELCATELPPHMVPRGVEFVGELPRSPNGKVDYKLLRAERIEEDGA